MKLLPSLLIACLLAVKPSYAAETAEEKPVPFDPFSLTPEYRKVHKFDNSVLSPFRKPEARAAQAAASTVRNSGPNLPAVLSKFHQLGLTGVIPSTAKRPGLIILGGTIFREGQELNLADEKSRTRSPIVPDHKVFLKSVTGQALSLSVTHNADGATVAPANVPVGLLEFRQR